MHAVTEEAYLVCEGQGYLELHDLQQALEILNLPLGITCIFQPKVYTA